jgi:tetratricopeptide (TPR) repeat protein
VRIPLIRILALNGNEPEALEVLDRLLDDATLSESVRAEAETLGADLRDGKGLFTRASEMARDLVLDPPSKPLAAVERDALEQARLLLREAGAMKNAFATSWLLGKVEMRLGNMDAALVALKDAHALNAQQPDGCRELVNVYLELDRALDAVPIARRAVDLRRDDAGLRSNLALVLLLTGDVDGARAEVAAALSQDPTDTITRGLSKMIDDVVAGRRQRPRSIAEAEGRRRAV